MGFVNSFKLFFTFSFICLTINQVYCQNSLPTEDRKNHGIVYDLSVGYSAGGTGTVHFFTYNSAQTIHLSLGKQLNDRTTLTGSVGVEKNQEGTLYPIAGNMRRYISKKANHFLAVQIGYSLGSGLNADSSSSFTYKGGLVGGFAYGFNLLSINALRVYIQAGYDLRKAEVVFQPFEGSKSVSNKIENHFGSIKVGINF